MELNIGENCGDCVEILELRDKVELTTTYEDQARYSGELVCRGSVECPKGPRTLQERGEIVRICRPTVRKPEISNPDIAAYINKMWPGAPVAQPQE